MFEGPEKKFQRHIAEYIIREHKFAVLEQDDITDTNYYLAEDHLIAFLKATQKETFDSLAQNYGRDARGEIFKALNAELRASPLWMIKTQVHPREVFADPLADRACAVILTHNRTVGQLKPSDADIETTKRLRQAGEIMDINVLDHIIFNQSGYFSFLENGKI